jgi:hypothetical protein
MNANKEFEDAMKIYHCDWRGKCNRKPYIEAFPLTIKPESERELPCDLYKFEGWSYLCRWHFYRSWLKHNILYKLIGSKKRLGYGYAETESEMFNRLLYEKSWDENDKLKKENRKLKKYVARLQNRFSNDGEGHYRNEQYFNALDWVSILTSRGYEPEKHMSEEMNDIKGFFELEDVKYG